MALSTVSLWLKRIGLGKRSRLTPSEPPNRYERRRPGELVHVDVKKLARIGARGAGHRVTGTKRGQARDRTGYEFVHVCVDDATPLAYVEVLADERALTAIGFFRRAAWVGTTASAPGPARCSAGSSRASRWARRRTAVRRP